MSDVTFQGCNCEWRCRSMMAMAVAFPVLLALILSWVGLQHRPTPFEPVTLRPAMVTSVSQLKSLFGKLDYQWPPVKRVPAISIRKLPSDFGSLPPEQKKSLFFRSLLPLVVAENTRLRMLREWLLKVQAGKLTADPQRLRELTEVFRVSDDLSESEKIAQLLQRVDVVPAGLVLAQAANESGWGTSRFSREVNNLFGEWTWDSESGVVPRNRPGGASHFVRRFESLRQSVNSYLHNLNSGHAYDSLRALRAKMRREGVPLDPVRLASGLKNYSARGAEYVKEIQRMILSNGLNKLGQLDLHH